jgi:nitrogen fixation NifU-like protein
MQETILSTGQDGIKDMLAAAGYSAKAIKYYTEKPYMGILPDADQCSELTGSCGDTMEVYVKVEGNIIQDVRYQVMGCAGAVSAADLRSQKPD